MNSADAERFAAWLNAHGLSETPQRDRRATARENLAGIEKVLERTEATRKYAPDSKSREKIDSKLSRLEREAMRLEHELDAGDLPTCSECEQPIDPHAADYGRCPCHTRQPDPHTDRRIT